MNRGVLENSPVHHFTADGNPNWYVSGGLKHPPPLISHLPPPSFPNFFPSPSLHPLSSNPNYFYSLLETSDLPLDHPWSFGQLFLGGESMMEEEEQVLRQEASMKEESSNNGSVIMSSPPTTHDINEVDKNNHNFSECNKSLIGGFSIGNKKPKLQVSSTQSNLKVRKEKLGGRITALHQLVSPFGKTDTASVLSEALGYIRFLYTQIEALSLPYFVTSSRSNILHQHGLGDYMNGILPKESGQVVVNEYCMKRSKGGSTSCTDNQESNPNTDLKSKGLCLVPISSSTLHLGPENGTITYWPPPFGITFR